VDVAAKATEVEHLVIPGNDEKGALERLKPLDMSILLKVAETRYTTIKATLPIRGRFEPFNSSTKTSAFLLRIPRSI
jgi:hypothetical protein